MRYRINTHNEQFGIWWYSGSWPTCMYLTYIFKSLLATAIIGRNRQTYYAKNTFLPRSKCSQLNHYLSKLDLNYKIVIRLRAQLKMGFPPIRVLQSRKNYVNIVDCALRLLELYSNAGVEPENMCAAVSEKYRSGLRCHYHYICNNIFIEKFPIGWRRGESSAEATAVYVIENEIFVDTETIWIRYKPFRVRRNENEQNNTNSKIALGTNCGASKPKYWNKVVGYTIRAAR